MARTLSPRELADALGVSESSLKRWIDAGRIRATRTGGGHRRIAHTDALAFIRLTGAPVVRPELLALADATPAPVPVRGPCGEDVDRALFRALIEGDGRALAAWIDASRAAGASLAALCDGPLRTAMHAIGELWQHDADGVFIEHRATDLCIVALARLRAAMDPSAADAPLAVGGAPEDDPYLLPSTMAALVLADAGLRAVNLGASTPAAALHRAIARHHPRLLWLSASAPLSPPRAHELTALLAALPATVTAVVGGRHRAAIADAARTAGAARVRVIDTMAELAAIARAL